MRHPLATALAAMTAALSLAMAAGCQVERAASDFPDQQLGDAGAADSGASGDVGLGAGPGAGTMGGTWLLVHERSSCVLRQEQLTQAAYLVDITQDGAVLDETRRLCELELTPVFGMQIDVPPAVLRAIDFVPVDRGMISTLRIGGTYVSSTEVALWGLDLDAPMTDPVPESADDPAVIDTDGDGHPAVSYTIGGDCQRYNAQRQIIVYQGRLTAPNQIDGTSAGATDLVVYGGSDPVCTIAPPVESNDPHSRFRMVRVDGRGGAFNADVNGDDAITCDEIHGLPERILPRRDADSGNCEQ